MKIRFTIKNKTISFDQAIDYDVKILEIMLMHGLIDSFGTNFQNMFQPGESIKAFLVKYLSKDIKKYLEIPNDLNTSSIGYHLPLVLKNGENRGMANLTFGKPAITGNDIVLLDFGTSNLDMDFVNMIEKIAFFMEDLCDFIKPIRAALTSPEIQAKFNDYDIKYGLILFDGEKFWKTKARTMNEAMLEIQNTFI